MLKDTTPVDDRVHHKIVTVHQTPVLIEALRGVLLARPNQNSPDPSDVNPSQSQLQHSWTAKSTSTREARNLDHG